MSGSSLRIRSSREGYRRAGLVFGSAPVEVAEADLADDQALKLFADPVLAIQVQGEDGGWITLAPGYRRMISGQGAGVSPAAPAVEAFARLTDDQARLIELGRELEEAIADAEAQLKSADLWPVADPARLFQAALDQLGEARGVIAALGEELDQARAAAGSRPEAVATPVPAPVPAPAPRAGKRSAGKAD